METLTETKEILNFLINDIDMDEPDHRKEVIAEIENGTDDFEVNDYRFIHAESIDKIQQDELSSDEYILGCFNDWFLAGILDIDVDVIQAMQKAEAYEEIGKLVLSMDKLEELQEAYSDADGYGHHFAHYDHQTHEIGEYYVFRTN